MCVSLFEGGVGDVNILGKRGDDFHSLDNVLGNGHFLSCKNLISRMNKHHWKQENKKLRNTNWRKSTAMSNSECSRNVSRRINLPDLVLKKHPKNNKKIKNKLIKENKNRTFRRVDRVKYRETPPTAKNGPENLQVLTFLWDWRQNSYKKGNFC